MFFTSDNKHIAMKKNDKPTDPKINKPAASTPTPAPGSRNQKAENKKGTSVDADLEKRKNEYRNTRSEL